MSRREEILKLATAIRNTAADAKAKDSDKIRLLSCNAINAAAAELVRLTRAEACEIIDSNMEPPV